MEPDRYAIENLKSLIADRYTHLCIKWHIGKLFFLFHYYSKVFTQPANTHMCIHQLPWLMFSDSNSGQEHTHTNIHRRCVIEAHHRTVYIFRIIVILTFTSTNGLRSVFCCFLPFRKDKINLFYFSEQLFFLINWPPLSYSATLCLILFYLASLDAIQFMFILKEKYYLDTSRIQFLFPTCGSQGHFKGSPEICEKYIMYIYQINLIYHHACPN